MPRIEGKKVALVVTAALGVTGIAFAIYDSIVDPLPKVDPRNPNQPLMAPSNISITNELTFNSTPSETAQPGLKCEFVPAGGTMFSTVQKLVSETNIDQGHPITITVKTNWGITIFDASASTFSMIGKDKNVDFTKTLAGSSACTN